MPKYTFMRFLVQMFYTCITGGVYPFWVMFKYFHEH